MIEPLTAFALAGNIVQFVEVGCKVTYILQQLWKGSATDENLEIEIAMKDLDDICTKLASTSKSSTVPSEDDAKLRVLAQSCQKLSKELHVVLQKLVVKSKADDPRRRLEVLQKALKSMLEADKIKDLQKRLGALREQISIRMMYMLTDRQSESFRRLEEVANAGQKQSDQLSKSLREVRIQAQRACEDHKEQLEKLKQSLDAVVVNTGAIQATVTKLSLLSDHVAATATSTEILKSLQFPLMHDRYSLIQERHPETFSWIFKGAASPFKTWLEQDSGAFWISGKAGSGKSTLMKFLNRSPQLRASLNIWAGGRQLFIASFYFWITGTRMQKTQEGLLQSILHEILRQEPALIPKVVPARWMQDGSFHETLQPWTLAELYDALESVIHEKPTACFCFLIDGLDEYAGDAGEQGLFADRIHKLANSSMVKVCVASRPWTAFENVFGDPKRMLEVQDLTKDDMDRFVKNTLEEDPRFAVISRRDSRAVDLIHEIRESAQGVFLWVVLVVKSLLAGATQEDDVEELTKRLRAFPRDLKGFFQRMLDSIDESYEQHASRILLLALYATPLPLMAFSWVRVEIKTPDYAIIGHIEQRDDDERRKRQAKVFLNKWSKDLLVIYNSSSQVHGTEDMADLKIDFLHRTVGDFLKEPEVHSILLAKAGHGFDPHLSICRLLLAETKTIPTAGNPKSRSNSLQALAQRLIFHAKQYEIQNGRGLTVMLQELDHVMTSRLSGFNSSHWSASIEVTHPGQFGSHRKAMMTHNCSNFLAYAVASNLAEFVRETLDTTPSAINKSGRPLLDFALYASFPRHDQPDHLTNNDYPEQLVRLLLERGSSPNDCAAVVGAMTVWQMFLLDNRAAAAQTRTPKRAGAWEVAQSLLTYGADRETRVPFGKVVSGVVLMQGCGEDADLCVRRTVTEEVDIIDCLQSVVQPQVVVDFISNLPVPRSRSWWALLPWRA